MLDNLSLVSDRLTEAMLEDKVTPEVIRASLREATIALKCTPVMMGSALGNKAVQLLLDGVCSYLPDPCEVENVALDLSTYDERRTSGTREEPEAHLLVRQLPDG